MSSINKIISNLENELQQLLAPYKKQINDLENENKKLQNEIKILMGEKNNLQKQLDSLTRRNLTVSVDNQFLESTNQLNSPVTFEMIDHLFISSSMEDSLFLLLIFNHCVEENNLEKIHYILELLTHNPKPLLHNDQGIKNIAARIYDDLIVSGDKENELLDKILLSFFQLLYNLFNTQHKVYLTGFLKENYPDLLDRALYSNEPKIIIPILKLLMKFEMETELEDVLSHIIKVEWGFLDYNLTKEEFAFFLWYAYLFDMDQQLLDKSEDCIRWMDEKESIFQLYSFLFDAINNQKADDDQLGDLCHGLRQSGLFNEKESQKIINKVRTSVDKFKVMKPSFMLPTYLNPLTMVDSEKLRELKSDLMLQEKRVLVPFYKDEGVNLLSGGYAELTVYLAEYKVNKKKKEKAFVDSKLIEEIHKRSYPEKLRVVKYNPKDIIPIQSKNTVEEKKNDSFQWPSTEINENAQHDHHEQPLLNEYSELKKQGYQITGLTRTQRWAILQKAVPVLGLKKVAYTIVYNVRLRKGQKNGPTKFSYAIGEWEYDLYKLKKTYYKKEFTWPSY